MGQPQLSSGTECWQLLNGLLAGKEIPQIYPVHGAATTFFRYRTLAAWEEIPQIYLLHGAATTFFRYKMQAATQGVTCLGGDPTDLPGTWGSYNFLQV
jgi:hypothetical protein